MPSAYGLRPSGRRLRGHRLPGALVPALAFGRALRAWRFARWPFGPGDFVAGGFFLGHSGVVLFFQSRHTTFILVFPVDKWQFIPTLINRLSTTLLLA